MVDVAQAGVPDVSEARVAVGVLHDARLEQGGLARADAERGRRRRVPPRGIVGVGGVEGPSVVDLRGGGTTRRRGGACVDRRQL